MSVLTQKLFLNGVKNGMVLFFLSYDTVIRCVFTTKILGVYFDDALYGMYILNILNHKKIVNNLYLLQQIKHVLLRISTVALQQLYTTVYHT